MKSSTQASETVDTSPYATTPQAVLEGPLSWIVSMPPQVSLQIKGIRAIWRNETGLAQ